MEVVLSDIWLDCLSDCLSDLLLDLSLDLSLDLLFDPLVRSETSVLERTDALDFAGREMTQGTVAAGVRATGGDWALICFESLTILFISVSSSDSFAVKLQAIMHCNTVTLGCFA